MSPADNTYRTVPSDPVASEVIVTAVGMAWTVIVFVVRLYLRFCVNGPFSPDDVALTLGTIASAGQITATLFALHNGLGTREESLLDSIEARGLLQSIYAAGLLYILAICASKCSVTLLTARIVKAKHHRVAAHLMTGFAAGWGIVSVLLIGIPPWNSVARIEGYGHNLLIRWAVVEIFSMLVESMIPALWIYILWSIQMPFKNKAIVMGAFSCRVLILIPTGLRLHYLRTTLSASNRALEDINSVIATQAVMHFSLIAATIPCMKQFLRAFNTERYTVNIQETRTGRSQSQSNSYALHSIDQGRLRPEEIHHVTEVKHSPHREANLESRSIESDSSDKAIIWTTQAWEVSHGSRE